MNAPREPPAAATAGAAQPDGLVLFGTVFLPFALGHFLSCLIRMINAVLAPQLVAELGLDTGQLGLLTSAYFFAFALVQLPVGMALDRYGPRKVQGLMMLIAALGALMFAHSHNVLQLAAARFVLGAGLGGCFMSAIKAVSTWVAPGRLPSIQGYLMAVGGLGAASATLPVRMALQLTDWRGIFVVLALAAVAIGAAIWLFAPRQSGGAAARKPMDWQAVRAIYANRGFRDTLLLLLIPHTIFFGVQGLWIGRWLSDVARLPESQMAYVLYLAMAAVVLGSIGVGMLTEWAARRGIAPMRLAAAGVALFVFLQLTMACDLVRGYAQLAVLFTLAGTVTGMDYTIVGQSMPRELTGRATTCLNLCIFLGAFLMQAGFGQVIGRWTPDAAGHYPDAAYRCAFALLALLQLPGLILFLRRPRPVECDLRIATIEENHETAALRTSRKRTTGPVG